MLQLREPAAPTGESPVFEPFGRRWNRFLSVPPPGNDRRSVLRVEYNAYNFTSMLLVNSAHWSQFHFIREEPVAEEMKGAHPFHLPGQLGLVLPRPWDCSSWRLHFIQHLCSAFSLLGARRELYSSVFLLSVKRIQCAKSFIEFLAAEWDKKQWKFLSRHFKLDTSSPPAGMLKI